MNKFAHSRNIDSMDKKELIWFVLNDIKELGLIVEGLHEMDKIPKAMQELAISKTQNILDRFHQLGETPQKKEEIIPDMLIVNENLPIFEEKPEEIPEEEILEEEILEEVVQIQEKIIKEEKEKDNVPQKVEFKEEKTVLQSQLLFFEEEKTEEEEVILPVEEPQQPEEIKGTVIADEQTKVQERTTNEKFSSQIPTLNTIIASKRVERRFVQNLRKAINLNDRYRYQKELFGGSVDLMYKVIDKLDTMESLEEATAYLQKEFAWNAESGTVIDFYLLLESRFS